MHNIKYGSRKTPCPAPYIRFTRGTSVETEGLRGEWISDFRCELLSPPVEHETPL